MRWLFSTLNEIDTLRSAYSNFCLNKIVFKTISDRLWILSTILFAKKFE